MKMCNAKVKKCLEFLNWTLAFIFRHNETSEVTSRQVFFLFGWIAGINLSQTRRRLPPGLWFPLRGTFGLPHRRGRLEMRYCRGRLSPSLSMKVSGIGIKARES